MTRSRVTRRGRVALGPLLLGGALVAAGFAWLPREERRAAAPLGPLSRAAASVQWVRVDDALGRGDLVRGFELAERALALDPGASHGWALLVHEQLVVRAGAEREPDPLRRRAWIESGLATAERGLRDARDPGLVAIVVGIALHVLATGDDPPPWPAREGGLAAEAEAWFRRALELGRPEAGAFLVESGR